MKKKTLPIRALNHFVDLIFPQLCYNCQELLTESEKILCVSCKANLPVLDHHANIENYQEKFMDINPYAVFCFLQFRKDNVSQKLLHEFKYAGYRKIGYTLGFWFGEYIKESMGSENIDYIIPVPLHQKKLRKRGFNQSEIIAKGISESLNIPVLNNVIERIFENKTQTQKSRSERMLNVRGLFKVKNDKTLKEKHVLVIDDVITTGSTLASCASELQDADVAKVSLASLTMAK